MYLAYHLLLTELLTVPVSLCCRTGRQSLGALYQHHHQLVILELVINDH